MGPLYRTKRIQDTIHQNSSFVICSDQNESILLPVSQRRDRKSSQQTGSGKGTESGTPSFYSRIFLVPKKNGKFRLILDLSLLNRYIEKQGYLQTPDRAQLPDRTGFSVLWSFFLRYFILYAQLEEVYSIPNYFYLTPSFQYKKNRTKHNSTHIYIAKRLM